MDTRTESRATAPRRPTPIARQPGPGSGPLPAGARHLTTDQIINKINYLNFRGRHLTVRFRHVTLPRWLKLSALPDPCLEAQATCRWAPTAPPPRIPSVYRFYDILVDDGDGLLVLKPPAHRWDDRGGAFSLPPNGLRVNARRSRRYLCAGGHVELFQNSVRFRGTLVDFSAFSLMVRLRLTPPQSFAWITADAPVQLVLGDARGIAFAGECRVIRHQWGASDGTCVLEPVRRTLPRFKAKRYRSRRVTVLPAPDVVFTHPLTGRRVELAIHDLSGAGFSVAMDPSQDVLLPGLVIREARLIFAGRAAFDCRLQVIYTHRVDDAPEPRVRSGFAILDIPAAQHTRLLSLLYQVREPNAYINHTPDMEALWRFFFDTGFVYPEKYAFLHPHKASIQATYEKLYTRHPSFARHFTYQRMGCVLGHMAMLRFYNRAWLIQHHAASTAADHRAGLIVLEQIGRFINDSHRLYRIRMHYVFCLFRPENKFPSRVFGGAADRIGDPGACSRDTFAYLHLPPIDPRRLHPAGGGWRLAPADVDDLAELNGHYEDNSGGLLLRAFDLTPHEHDLGRLSAEYRAIGFRRERRLFALRRRGRTVAFFMANRADFGLNMSDLTNAIQLFVLDPAELRADVLARALWRISAYYPAGPVPLLVSPAAAAREVGLPAEKRYTAWVLDLEHTDAYFDYISRLLRGARRRGPDGGPAPAAGIRTERRRA